MNAYLSSPTGIMGPISLVHDQLRAKAFMGGKTNRLIIKTGKGAFDAQCIPTVGDPLTVVDYKAFLTARRTLIANRPNEFLGTR